MYTRKQTYMYIHIYIISSSISILVCDCNSSNGPAFSFAIQSTVWAYGRAMAVGAMPAPLHAPHRAILIWRIRWAHTYTHTLSHTLAHTYTHTYYDTYTHLQTKVRYEHIELPAKLLDYFLLSNKSNINQCAWAHVVDLCWSHTVAILEHVECTFSEANN